MGAMATIKVFDGETVVKELHTDLNVDDIAARLEAQPHEIALSVDGQPVVLEVLVHPTMKDTIDSVLAKARKKSEDVKDDEGVDVGVDEGDEEDERFKRLLALLEEAESEEDEESEEEAKASRTLNELVKAVKELREVVAKLQASEPKTDEVKKERAKQPVILKSWAPYERAQKFEQPKETELEKGQPTGIDPQAISDFQKELLKRLRVLP
jgi:vacuolar-type H+-ATPase subunit I/STV1